MSPVKLGILKACNGISALTGEKYRAPSFHVDSAIKKPTAQLNAMFTEERLRGMVEGRKHYARDAKF